MVLGSAFFAGFFVGGGLAFFLATFFVTFFADFLATFFAGFFTDFLTDFFADFFAAFFGLDLAFFFFAIKVLLPFLGKLTFQPSLSMAEVREVLLSLTVRDEQIDR